MTPVGVIARHEVLLLRDDPFPIVLLLVMPLVLLSFLANGLAGGPAQSIPGLAALFGLFGTSLIGLAFYRDHGWRTWNRLRASPARRSQVVAGKLLPLAVLFLLQHLLLLVAGRAVFGMPFEGDVLTAALVVVAIVAVEMSLGLLMTACCRTVNQITALANVGGLFLAGLGGGLAPLSTLPGWVRDIAPVSPVYWMLRAMRFVLVDGKSVTEVAPTIGVLLAFAAVAAVGGAHLLRFDQEKVFYS